MRTWAPTAAIAPIAGIGALLCGTALSVRAQDAPPPPPTRAYSLSARYTAGELLTYHMKMSSTVEMKTAKGDSPFPAVETTVSTTSRIHTTSVKPDGSAVNVVQTTDGEITAMGNTMPMPKTPPITMEIDRFGRGVMRGAEGLPGGAALQSFMNMNRMPTMGAILPDHPVHVGESWENEIPMPMGEGKMKIASTLMGVETVGGQETLKIKQVMTMPLNIHIGADQKPAKTAADAVMTMTGTFTVNSLMNILEKNARMVKSAADVSGSMEMNVQGDAAKQSPFGSQMNMTMNGKMSMQLVSAGTAPIGGTSGTASAHPAGKKAGGRSGGAAKGGRG